MINPALKSVPARAKQPLPGEIVADLMTAVRNGFYPGDDRWFAQQTDIRRMVVTWPAKWLNERGVTLSGARYKELLLAILNDVKRMGNTGEVKYWPRYLAHCVQQHFRCHGDEIYEEAKAIRHRVETVLIAGQKAVETAQGVDPVAALASAHQALKAAHKRRQRPAAKEQLSFL